MMYIDKYFDDDEKIYINDEGIWFDDDPLDFIQAGILDFCCCGNPEKSLKYTYEKLKEIDQRGTSNSKESMFVYYHFDSVGLTEHGSSVPGWLTEKGKGVMRDLEKLLPIVWFIVLDDKGEIVQDEWGFATKDKLKNEYWVQDCKKRRYVNAIFEVFSKSIQSREHALKQAKEVFHDRIS